MLNLLLFIYKKIYKGESDMAVVYATLIIEGYKTYAQIPKSIKTQVAVVLTQLGCEHLITE